MPVIDTSKYKRLTIDKLNTKGCLNLLEAFLREASKSFKTAYLRYLENPHNIDIAEHYMEYRNFFLSDYFSELTCLDGEEIVASLEYECNQRRDGFGTFLQA